MTLTDIQFQKSEWRTKNHGQFLMLLGGKQEYFLLVKQLVELLRLGEAIDIDTMPKFNMEYPNRNYGVSMHLF